MIEKEKFEKMKFTSFGFVESAYTQESHRLPKGHILSNHNTIDLRNMISNLLHDMKTERRRSIERLIELDCDISYATYKQCIGGKRKPTREFVAKLCVGLKLPLEKANALFRIQGGELNLTNDVDAITYYAILDQDDIFDYETELEEKAGVVSQK